jgi:hypothetical protein
MLSAVELKANEINLDSPSENPSVPRGIHD